MGHGVGGCGGDESGLGGSVCQEGKGREWSGRTERRREIALDGCRRLGIRIKMSLVLLCKNPMSRLSVMSFLFLLTSSSSSRPFPCDKLRSSFLFVAVPLHIILRSSFRTFFDDFSTHYTPQPRPLKLSLLVPHLYHCERHAITVG